MLQRLEGAAAIEALTGPWRPQPFLLDPVLQRQISDACRNVFLMDEDFPPMPIMTGAVIDSRGGGLVNVILQFDNGGAAGCWEIPIRDDGRLGQDKRGWQRYFDSLLPDPRPRELQVEYQHPILDDESGWGVAGSADKTIRTVLIEAPNQPPIMATVSGGHFLAWWPWSAPAERFNGFRVVGIGADGQAVFACQVSGRDDCFKHPGWDELMHLPPE